jgi:hypothetical protein
VLTKVVTPKTHDRLVPQMMTSHRSVLQANGRVLQGDR